jgi:hypothetical protein
MCVHCNMAIYCSCCCCLISRVLWLLMNSCSNKNRVKDYNLPEHFEFGHQDCFANKLFYSKLKRKESRRMDYQQCFLSSLAASSVSSFFLVDNYFFPVPLLSQYCLAKPCSSLPLFWTPSELNLKNKIKQSSRGSDGCWVFHHKTFKS